MSDPVLKKFGRFFLLDRIAQGGMAEIFRARTLSREGPARLVAIKRISSAYGSNKDFRDMFKAEVTATANFNHPNIIQIFDYSVDGAETDNQPYIVMEWIDGRNLRQYLNRYAEKGAPFPVELAAYLIEQAAAGLDYAHQFRDKVSGQSLDLVHRDISPQNILVSYDGSVKVIDFGIAKAATNSEQTRAGVIKGKPSYLSPEQIRGDVLDGRSDLFALAICFWELLTGKKLFSAPGENEFAVLKQIENCNAHVKPPSSHNAAVPRELDRIVLRALAKDREQRFSTVGEFQKELRKFLYQYCPDFDPQAFSQEMRTLFKEEILKDRQSLQSLNEQYEKLIVSEPVLASTPEKGGTERHEGTMTFSLADLGVNSESSEKPLEQKHETQSVPLATVPGMKRPQLRPVQNQASTAARNVQTPKRREAPMRIPRGDAVKPVSKPPRSYRSFFLMIVAAGVAAVFFAPDLFRLSNIQMKAQNASVERSSEDVEAVSSDANSILLRLNILPKAGAPAEIEVSGVRVDPFNSIVRVPLDRTLELKIKRSQYQNFQREFVLSSSQVSGLDEWGMDVELDPLQFGYVSIATTPSAEARITPVDLQGRNPSGESAWSFQTPFEREKFPAGKYRVELVNETLQMHKTVFIEVQDGKSIVVNETLEVR